ncbi:MAG: transcription-repair coupling factor [Erysipelotrichaceae bacterium]
MSTIKMHKLIESLKDNPAVEALINNSNNLGNLSKIEEALLLAALYTNKKEPLCIIKSNLYEAQELKEALQPLLSEEVLLFGVEESLRVEAIAASPEGKAAQIETMYELLNTSNPIVITHIGAVMRYMPNPKLFKKNEIELKIDVEMDIASLKEHLFKSGYSYVKRVDVPLTYASRGGIVDIYSMNYANPIRIEFFDNIIESIREFDVVTQRTIKELKEVTIIPATDILFSSDEVELIATKIRENISIALPRLVTPLQTTLKEQVEQEINQLKSYQGETSLYKYYSYLNDHYSIIDYINKPLVVISPCEEITTNMKKIKEEGIVYMQELFSLGTALPIYTLGNEVNDILAQTRRIEISNFVNYKRPIQSGIQEQVLAEMPLNGKIEYIRKEAKEKKVVLAIKGNERQQLINALEIDDIPYHILNTGKIKEGINFIEDEMNQGCILSKENISVYTSKELFQVVRHNTRYQRKFKEASILSSYTELGIGDFIVHNIHGVGKYLGIVTKEMNGIHKDYLNIAYKGNDILLVPLEQFKLVRKFVGKEGAVPKLNKLGSGDWEKTKQKINENIAELAERLVNLYSLREEHIGYAYHEDNEMQKKFEDEFQYPLTIDQERAVIEIKADMQSSKPMDRLLCGDVGYGKTEVAIRAAFKAVLENKQVAFLCPTTILASQHYKNFIKRFSSYPIRIEVINRFVSTQHIKEIIQDLKNGQVDVLIGTHRLLSKDVIFKDLGLLVIDEEQRFGVQHKEKIKELKNNIDVLSLSATPIPRTLQMSLVGVRQLSQLDTPPLHRMSVQTYVIEKNEQIIKEIIQRELARKGQVFYLYNNVKNIYALTTKLSSILKDVKIGIVHGQMDKKEIEDVMIAFTNNEYQVLVCTTIIETGIDIPNANTIIIEDADKFGLSQLYQIKGRVGRSDRLAYAYLMYSPQKNLSEIATKRLKSIKEFTQLGSGYKIAMRDLTIRGAGDMLGPKQAGFIDTIGMDMYLELLNNAINTRKGIIKEDVIELKKSNANVDAYIPENFSNEDYDKISIYQRIEAISNKQELLLMKEELNDTHGQLPRGVELLFEKKRLDILVNVPYVDSYVEYPSYVNITFTKEYSQGIDGIKLFTFITTVSTDIKLSYTQGKIVIKLLKSKLYLKQVIEILDGCKTVPRRDV